MRKLGMLYAMAMMLGGLNPMGGGISTPQRRPQPRKLSPEEEAQELEQRKERFLYDLERHNADRRINFPKFKEFEVHGLVIIAFNLKNAHRDMTFLMQKNLIQVKTN